MRDEKNADRHCEKNDYFTDIFKCSNFFTNVAKVIQRYKNIFFCTECIKLDISLSSNHNFRQILLEKHSTCFSETKNSSFLSEERNFSGKIMKIQVDRY